MGGRLKKAGGKVGSLTCSLMWNNTSDLDLRCETPNGDQISWRARKASCGGHLDGDANVARTCVVDPDLLCSPFAHAARGCDAFLPAVDMNASEKNLTTEPIENIYWDDPPAGHYRFWVVCEAQRQAVRCRARDNQS